MGMGIGLSAAVAAGPGDGGLLASLNAIALPTSGLQVQLESDGNTWPTLTTAQGLYTDTGLTTKATNGQTVKGLKDWSGNARHLTNGSASGVTCGIGPTFYSAAPAGRPSLNYGASGSNNWLRGATAADWNFMHKGPCTVYFLAKPKASANGVLFDTGGVNSSGPGVFAFYENSGKTGSLTVQSRGVGGTNGTVSISLSQRSTTYNAVPAGVWGVGCYDYDAGAAGAGIAHLYFNDGLVGNGQTTIGAPSTNDCRNALQLGDSNATGLPFGDSFAGLWAYNKVHTAAERAMVHRYISRQYGTPAANVAFIGDSITAGSNLGGAVNAGTYVQRAGQLLGGQYAAFNFGVSGHKIADCKTVFESGSVSPALTPVWRNGFRIVVCEIGINNLGVNGDSGSTTWTALEAFWNEITADSQTYLVGWTIPPFKGYAGWNSTTPDDYDYVNNAIKAYRPANGNFACVDAQQAFAGGADRYTMPTGLTFDGIHPNQAGCDLMAQAVTNKIRALNLY